MKLLVFALSFLSLVSFGQVFTDSLSIYDPGVRDALKTLKNKHANLSIVNLIATPERYDGEQVQVRGYLHLENNGNALYLNEDDYKNKITANAIWIQFNEKFAKSKGVLDYDNKYVILIGKFDSGEKGYNGLFSGSIKNVIRMD
jgi:hypothetical protein